MIHLQEIEDRQVERKETEKRWEDSLKRFSKIWDVKSKKEKSRYLDKLQTEFARNCKDAVVEIDVLIAACRHLATTYISINENRESVGAYLVTQEVEDAISAAYLSLYGEDQHFENVEDENGNTQLTIGNDPDEPEDEDDEDETTTEETGEPSEGIGSEPSEAEKGNGESAPSETNEGNGAVDADAKNDGDNETGKGNVAELKPGRGGRRRKSI